MTSPIPFNDSAQEDMFDRGLDKLLAGNMSGLDDIEPDLHDTVLTMVGLANNAGWIGTEPGPPPKDTRPLWLRWEPVISKIAAIFLVGLIAAAGFLALRVIEDRPDDTDEVPFASIEAVPTEANDFSYASQEQAALGSGVCGREPRTAEKITRIVDEPYTSWNTPKDGDQQSHSELNANLVQVTRDWTTCLATGQYDRAMAYESENYLRAMAEASDSDIADDLTDEQIATIVANQHRELKPMAYGEDNQIVIYKMNWSTSASGITSAEIWMVPVDPSGEWVEWPTVITFVYEDGRWVIQLTDREGSPATPVPDPANK